MVRRSHDTDAVRTLFTYEDVTKMVMIAVRTARLIVEPEPTSMLQNRTLPLERVRAAARPEG
jgi:hypothetical protein